MARSGVLYGAIQALYGILFAVFAVGGDAYTAASAALEIVRDETGLPHVYGDSNYDVFYGFGYISAHDRMFQMEMRKRQSLGRVAEVLGAGDKDHPEKYIRSDKAARGLINPELIRRQLAALPKTDLEIVTAFTDGVNAAMAEMMERPDERLAQPFFDYDFQPEPWTVEDTMITAVHIMGAFSAFNTQLDNARLYKFLRGKFPGHCDDIFDQLLWPGDVNAPTTSMDHPRDRAIVPVTLPRGCSASVPNALMLDGVIGQAADNTDHAAPMLAQMQAEARASMSWAVGSDRADGFRSIYVAGPQPGWNSASAYYPIGLHGGDFDVVGLVTAGSFVVRLGVNSQFTWSSTSGLSSQTDFYQETLSADGQHYFHDGAWKPLSHRPETIRVRDGQDLVLDLRSTLHGTLTAEETAADRETGTAYARKIVWLDGSVSSVMAWVGATRVQDFASWLARARMIDYSYNLLYADRDGHVGFIHAGAYPRRRAGHDHRLPVSGQGDFEWQGRIPAEDNPWAITKDFIVNFNNKPSVNWPNSGLYWEQWAASNQVSILIDAVAAKSKLTWDDMWAINRMISFRDVGADFLVPFIESAGRHADPGSTEAAAVEIISAWNRMRTDDDRDGLVDHAGQTLYDAWLAAAARKLLHPTLDGFAAAAPWMAAAYQAKPVYPEHTPIGVNILHHAFLSRKGLSAVHHHYDFLAGQEQDSFILSALKDAVTELKKQFDGPMPEWRGKATHHLFSPTNAAGIPLTGPDLTFTLPVFMNRGAVNLMTGYGLTGKAGRSAYVNPPGQSGHITRSGSAEDNPFFANHMTIYDEFGLLPLHRSRADVLANRKGDIIRLTPQR